MKIRYLLLAILLITAILFSSCANSINNQNTEYSDKESITESSTNLPTEKATETSIIFIVTRIEKNKKTIEF